MSLLRVVRASLIAALLAGCSPAALGHGAAAAPTGVTPGYVTIHPDVSVSRNAEPTALEPPPRLDEHADVMAEILAIPPGH